MKHIHGLIAPALALAVIGALMGPSFGGPSISMGPASATAPGYVSTGAQSFAGLKTTTITHVDSSAETLRIWNLDEDTSSLRAVNWSASNAVFSPGFTGLASSSNRRTVYGGKCQTDSGTTPVVQFDAAIGTTVTALAAGTSVATKPLFQFSNNGTVVMAVSAAGGVAIQGGTTPSLTVGASGAAITRVLSSTATLDFGSTAAGTVSDLTITVTGAADGDTVAIGVPNASNVAAGTFSGRVSATDTVTIRYANNALVTAYDPASGTFRATVIKF